MTAVVETTVLDAAHDVVDALGDGVLAAYAVGSASPLDVVVVWEGPLSRAARDELVEQTRSMDVALVVYAEGERVLPLDAADEPPFWRVLNRAVAQAHAVPLVGPPWAELFDPVPRRDVVDALHEMLRWQGEDAPRTAERVLNTVRALGPTLEEAR